MLRIRHNSLIILPQSIYARNSCRRGGRAGAVPTPLLFAVRTALRHAYTPAEYRH
ncbi:MAG: hypothetical protein IJR13_09965 [Bacteroidales bacterium]|nr:hypothetical protein [Bacteroidales bacterium]